MVRLLPNQDPVCESLLDYQSLRAPHIEHRNNHLNLCFHSFWVLGAGVYAVPKSGIRVQSTSGPP